MRLRDITIWLICILLTAALLTIAGIQLDFINSQRYDMKLISNEPLKNAPPSLAFATVAMGAFRGLVVDFLWLRADKLKQEGQFFDAKQLAEWITILQPRFTKVWEFQAWNMAYNISVAIPATQPDQRWRWVKNGYELLRDEGIPLNPHSILLYQELGRIFQHKIGGVSDDAHKYYKLQLALAMEPLVTPANNHYFSALAQAPVELQQILQDPNVAMFVKALKSTDETFADNDKLVNNYLSLRQNPDRFNPKAFRIIDNFRGSKALEKFDTFAKAYQLRNVWKLDPVLMEELNKTYGPIDWNDPNRHSPLDWRHPDTHALYWSVKGLQAAGGKEYFSVDEANTGRMVNHSLQNLFRYGKMFIYDIPSQISEQAQQTLPQPSETPNKEVFLRQDLRMFEPYNKSTLAIIEKYKNIRRSTYVSLQNGHRNMLKNAILSFYQTGHRNQAQAIYNQLRQLYPLDEYKVPLIIFVRNRLKEELQRLGINDAKEIIQMLLRESYFRYAMRDDNEAFGREKMAREVYDHYQKIYPDEHRVDLPDFKLLRYFALLDFFNDQQYPPYLRQSLIGRLKIERPELAEQLRQQEEHILKQQK